MIFDHETTPAVRSKSTGRLYPSVADLVTAEGAKLLLAILDEVGFDSTEEEAARLWASREKLLALLISARSAIEESHLYAAVDAASKE